MHYSRVLTTGGTGGAESTRQAIAGAICAGPDCDRPAHAKGLCGSHYHQLRNTGELSPLKRVRRSTRGMTIAERIEHYSAPPNENGCRLWTGHKSGRPGQEYAMMTVNGRTERAHRIVYQLMTGEPLKSYIHVHHTCGVNDCVFPGHLERSTVSENTLEMLARTSLEAEIADLKGQVAELKQRNAELQALLSALHPESELISV